VPQLLDWIEVTTFSVAMFAVGEALFVAGPMAATNAAAARTLVPLLTLGLPTTATAAIMLAGFQQFGLQPGPLVFVTSPQRVWRLIFGRWPNRSCAAPLPLRRVIGRRMYSRHFQPASLPCLPLPFSC
jgi:TctA family transporter